MEKMLLKPSELQEVCGLGRLRDYEMLATGELPSIRIGRSIRIPVEVLREWIAQQSNQATSEQ